MGGERQEGGRGRRERARDGDVRASRRASAFPGRERNPRAMPHVPGAFPGPSFPGRLPASKGDSSLGTHGPAATHGTPRPLREESGTQVWPFSSFAASCLQLSPCLPLRPPHSATSAVEAKQQRSLAGYPQACRYVSFGPHGTLKNVNQCSQIKRFYRKTPDLNLPPHIGRPTVRLAAVGVVAWEGMFWLSALPTAPCCLSGQCCLPRYRRRDRS